MSSYALCCATNLIAPFGLPQNSFCCSIIAPVSPTFNQNTGGTCASIDCSSYSPNCFTVSGSNLCQYLAGIDVAICSLKTSIQSIGCSSINMTGIYQCINGWVQGTPLNLCTWAQDVNNTFCAINNKLNAGITNNVVTGVSNNNTVTDGNNGTLTSTTGLAGNVASLLATNNVVHGSSSASLKTTSNLTGTGGFSTQSNISVNAGQVYEIKGFVYATAGGASPSSGTVSIIVNGTGTQQQIKTVSTSNVGKWLSLSMRYTPDVSQNITISVQCTNFTINSYLNFADITMQPVTATNSGQYLEFQIPQFDDLSRTWSNIASNFAASLNYSTTGLYITAGADTLFINGKTILTTQQTIGLLPNTTTYVFYDTWTDKYVTKSTSGADDTQLLIYTIVTNGSVVTSKTIGIQQPFTGNNIQPLSITGSNIALNTISSSNLINTTVTAGTYGDSANSTHSLYATVNAQGQITSLSAISIAFPVTSVNSLTGAISLGLGNLNNVSLTSPSNGQYLSYNGSNWVNVAAPTSYYQNVYGSLSLQTQRPGINFNGYFSVSDDNVNHLTTVSIALNGLTYDRIQSESANTLLGNSTGSSGNVQEITLTNDLSFQSGSLGVNYVINKQGVNYTVQTTDFTGATILECTVGGISIQLIAANTVATGRILRIKDTSGNAGSSNITILAPGGATIDGAASIKITTNYGHVSIYSDNSNWYTI